jgi:hypothetical protein
LENGEIVEEGTHEELMAKEDGIYRRLVEIQMRMSETLSAADFNGGNGHKHKSPVESKTK